MKVVLYLNETPIGRVEFIENLDLPGTAILVERVVGLWKTMDGDFFVCKRKILTMAKCEEYAEVISEPEAKHYAAKSPDLYEFFFGPLKDIQSVPARDG